MTQGVRAFFWPDLAPCHYAIESQQLMTKLGITYVPKSANPPAAPQIRPIEQFWGDLKMKVYEGNRSFDNPASLERRIRKCIQEYDMSKITNMFKSLKQKIHQANQNGLTSLD